MAPKVQNGAKKTENINIKVDLKDTNYTIDLTTHERKM